MQPWLSSFHLTCLEGPHLGGSGPLQQPHSKLYPGAQHFPLPSTSPPRIGEAAVIALTARHSPSEAGGLWGASRWVPTILLSGYKMSLRNQESETAHSLDSWEHQKAHGHRPLKGVGSPTCTRPRERQVKTGPDGKPEASLGRGQMGATPPRRAPSAGCGHQEALGNARALHRQALHWVFRAASWGRRPCRRASGQPGNGSVTDCSRRQIQVCRVTEEQFRLLCPIHLRQAARLGSSGADQGVAQNTARGPQNALEMDLTPRSACPALTPGRKNRE